MQPGFKEKFRDYLSISEEFSNEIDWNREAFSLDKKSNNP